MYGKGLNSIPIRFALASAILTLVGVGLRELALADAAPWTVARALSLAGLAALVSLIVFAMATKLTSQISSLQRSTEAIAAGDLEAPVLVDCNCEVGGLAHSFRKMTARFNANLLRINALAYTDPLTSLPNRTAVNQLLAYSLAPERSGEFRAAIVFIDLDGFKRINDTLGHDGGDELLKLASARILARAFNRTITTIDTCTDAFGNPCERLPEDVVFARFAGDEFVAVLPGLTDRAALARVGEAVIGALAEPFRIKNQDVTVGASVGIAIAPEDAASASELLTFADLAMYGSKQAGRARFTFFDKKIRAAILERAWTENALRRALERRELVLHYQPKIAARTGELAGVEALVRWNQPERGMLYPDSFIEVAEKSGLMAVLGEQVIELALAQCRAWLDAGIRRPIAVNVAPSQFANPLFADIVLAAVAGAGVPADLLTIEITESTVLTDFQGTKQRLEVLRGAGVKVAIDDFGVGFSNLSQLSRLPVDEVKIDRSLVVQIGQGEKGEAIIRAVLAMTQALGYETVAEGVETREQNAFLIDLGCDRLQGYLHARPMPAEALAAWGLARSTRTSAAPRLVSSRPLARTGT